MSGEIRLFYLLNDIMSKVKSLKSFILVFADCEAVRVNFEVNLTQKSKLLA